MLSWTSPKVTIKKIGKKGAGSFANAPIAKDETVIVQGGRIMENKSVDESEYAPFGDHCFQMENDLMMCPIEPTIEKLDGICLVNHSCDPTCGMKGQIIMVAMRDIRVGEEITFDYAMTDANCQNVTCTEMKCLCGANNCRGIITGDDWKRKDLQEKYQGYFSTHIQQRISATLSSFNG